MADLGKRKSEARRQPNRLQKRAPPTLQVSPVVEWNAAIPLLSPLVSPTSDDPKMEIRSCSSNGNEPKAAEKTPEEVLKKWQHPASPFYYNPAPYMPFVHTGNSDR